MSVRVTLWAVVLVLAHTTFPGGVPKTCNYCAVPQQQPRFQVACTGKYCVIGHAKAKHTELHGYNPGKCVDCTW